MIDTAAFDEDGYAIVDSVLSSAELATILAVLEARKAPTDKRGCVRDIIDRIPELQSVPNSPFIREIVTRVLGDRHFLVRATLFDKTSAANWKVPWHQDVTIAVTRRSEVKGYGPWSLKEGVLHVQPPSRILENMMTVRVHLDDCPTENGALRVMAGTHRLGRLNQLQVEEHVKESSAVACEVHAGGALIMRPLLLHASSAAARPGHRRVLHFDFAAGELDGDLDWRLYAHGQKLVAR